MQSNWTDVFPVQHFLSRIEKNNFPSKSFRLKAQTVAGWLYVNRMNIPAAYNHAVNKSFSSQRRWSIYTKIKWAQSRPFPISKITWKF